MKWVLKYVNNTLNYGLIYKKRYKFMTLEGYVDSDYAGDRDKWRSTSAFVMTLGGNCINWKAQLQPVVALSTTEAGYMALTEGFKEAIWLQGLLGELKVMKEKGTVYSDS